MFLNILPENTKPLKKANQTKVNIKYIARCTNLSTFPIGALIVF